MEIKEMAGKYVASVPAVYLQLSRAMENPDSTFKEYENIIHSDPALSAKLLKIVNSSFYGFSSRVETVSHALSILGVEHVAELALGTGVMTGFKGIDPELMDMEQFWKHCIACGVASRFIAESTGQPGAEQYYLAGMLHEIGSLVLFLEAPQKMARLLEHNFPDKDDPLASEYKPEHMFELEMKKFGFNHSTLGQALTEDWKLPERFSEAIGFHHEPGKARHFPMFVSIIHIADCMVYEMGIGKSGEPLVPEIDPDVSSLWVTILLVWNRSRNIWLKRWMKRWKCLFK